MKIKVKCPAKINLTLKVFKKDEITAFHPIESVMQTINLYDYLTVELTNSNKIELSGNSPEIAYDDSNLIYKAAIEFFKLSKIRNNGLKIYLEKNIPIAAGLAGGSTDAAGMVFALNYLYKFPLSEDEIFKINSMLGSDINFCYKGGCKLCKGKGDIMTSLEFVEFPITLVKPKNLKISTKEAYSMFDNLLKTPNMPNYLEFALLDKYSEIKKLHDLDLQMSGSGPTFFIKKTCLEHDLDRNQYQIIEKLKSVNEGITLVEVDF